MPKSTPEVVYLTLPDTVGLEAAWHRTPEGVEVPNPKAGQPAPLREIVITIQVPTMLGNDIVNDSRRVAILPRKTPVDPDSRDMVDAKTGALLAARIIDADARIVESGHPAVTAYLTEMGYLQCDPPEKRVAKTTTSEEG